MFNLKRKIKQTAHVVKQSFETPRDPQELIAEIHQEFDSATDSILSEAKSILSNIRDVSKGERLKKLGFDNSKPSVDATAEIHKRETNKFLAESVEYFAAKYPNNKFISEQKAKQICQKYGLLMAQSIYYKGDVPDKNLTEIESFQLQEEDYCKRSVWEHHNSEGATHRYYYSVNLRGKYDRGERETDSQDDFIMELPRMEICASVKDFNTADMRIEDGYKLQQNIPDPIVLQPVNGGYLIVSKWGLEAEDKDLVNEKMN